MTRIDRHGTRAAEILSTAGAAVLGGGVALLVADRLAPHALPLLAAGALAHGWGMYSRHRDDSRTGVTRFRWERPMYWLCWIALAAVLAYALTRS